MHRELISILDEHGVELHALLVRLTLRADVAGDLFQELFLKLADSRAFLEAREPAAYVRRVAINLAFDWRRRQARGRAGDAVEGPEPVDPAPPAWMRLSQREEIEQILVVASDLPAMSREAFVLRYVHGFDYSQVGQAMGRTCHQARGLCHHAIQEIRRRLGARVGRSDVRLEVFHE